MKTSLFDFDFPESLIAAHPANPRDAARMLVLPRAGEGVIDSHIKNLCDFLKPGDVMVFNDTKVIPARLFGKRGQAKVEVLLHRTAMQPDLKGQISNGKKESLHFARCPLTSGTPCLWRAFARPAKRLKPGDRIDFAEDFNATVIEKLSSGEVILAFDDNLYANLERYGHMPLPPYIKRGDDTSDHERYQTVYARHEGSVAAPTAGLHFTESLLAAIDAAGVTRAQVTLHVGGGTFLPVKSDDTEGHVMHSEYATVTPEAVDIINAAKSKGGRVIAVGTTSLRTLESAAGNDGRLKPFSGETSIFITPGYRFKIVDMLLTNFHLPRSTLFMLVCAFSGLERMQSAYAHAIAHNYRFYSYGDACLLGA